MGAVACNHTLFRELLASPLKERTYPNWPCDYSVLRGGDVRTARRLTIFEIERYTGGLHLRGGPPLGFRFLCPACEGRRGRERTFAVYSADCEVTRDALLSHIVEMQALDLTLFDWLLVRVHFGRCPECGLLYWG